MPPGSPLSTCPSSRWRAPGVAVDADLRADGVENVLVAGASLPGATPWREGSGEGIALASGYRAAALIAAGLKTKEGVAS